LQEQRVNLPPFPTMRRCGRVLLIIAVGAAGLAACGGGGDDPADPGPVVEDPGPVHVHGLGINPRDGALFVATHTGLFRAPPGERRARRVADRYQDTMGFTVTGPNRFLGSGHPDGREALPPFLGLIRSSDAGRTWEPVSLMGERDFHVLEAAGPRIYGYGTDFDSEQASLLVSDDGGRTWEERMPPEPLVSLAIDPDDANRVVAAGEHGTYTSADAGQGWRPVGADSGLVTWAEDGPLVLVRFDGSVFRSSDAGLTWEQAGGIGGQPAALESAGDDFYVALHDGTIKRSADAGETWSVRARP
jgi:BNR/Asp-box repeat protein